MASGTRIRRPGRILVIDDELAFATTLQQELSEDNYVVLVTEASAGLARLERGEVYDVLLCELMMPDMDGIDLHRRVSAKHPDVAARMVFMTEDATTARIDAFFGRVSNILLEKPVDIEGLRALIDRRVGGDRVTAAAS